jgi:hypothetical protein
MNAEFITAQARADVVAKALGLAAPPPLIGESLFDYRCRLVLPYLKHSAHYKSADLSKVADPTAFNAAEDSIYADAMTEAEHPSTFKPGQLRTIATPDASGRVITRYFGDPNACWDQFNPPVRYLRRFCIPGR